MSPRTESNASAAAVPEPPASAMVSSSSGGSPSWAWTQSFPFGDAILSASVTAARLVAVFFSGFLLLPGQPLSPPLRPELPTLRAPRLRPGPPRLLPPGPPLGLGGHEDPANPLGCGHGEAPASFSARPTGACNSPPAATAAARLAVRSGKCSSWESPPRKRARQEVYQLIPKRCWTGRVAEIKRLSYRQAEVSGGSHVGL